MDPLSMTASIIAILQLTTTLTGYIIDVRNATAEQAKVAVEASNLYNLLTSLRFRVEAARSDDPWFQQVKMLGMHDGPLDQFKDVLEKTMRQISSSGKRNKVKSALTWKFTKSEVDDTLKQIERLKSLINCALTEDLLTLSQVIHDDIVALKEQTEAIQVRTERLQDHANEELQNKLSRWLGLPDPSTNFHAALEKRHPETGLWFVNGQQFNGWKDSASSLIWLHGNAGCGKTVLSAASLQNINRPNNTRSDTVVIYFYFDFNDVEKQSWKKAIRSLLFQCALQQQSHLQILEQLYQRCNNGLQQPAEDVIRALLKDALVSIRYKHIILDALDECADREEFLTFIRRLVDSQQEGLRIMITSRREKDIEEQLGSIANYNIDIQSAVVDEDIRVYVRDRLAADSKLKKWPVKVQQDIMAAMMEKADGMFRWVYCQLESIRQCVKLNALKRALSTLPKTLYETYDRILQGIESTEQLQDATTALRWLCFSKRPLLLSEIVEVLAIEHGDSGGFCPDERLPDPTDIMVICSSLINCNDNGKEACDIPIRLAHFSVKEYLLSDGCLLKLDFHEPVCHLAIAEDCLHYLLYLYENLPLTEDLVDQHPLSRYAAQNWWQHAQALDGTLNPQVINLARRLLMNKDAGVLPWIQLYDVDSPWRGINLSLAIKDAAPPLYYAASIGLSQVVENIMPQIIDINAKGGRYGNALKAASLQGHERIVQILLDTGADVKAEGGIYSYALQAASDQGHESIVQMLLDARADINARGEYVNALPGASRKGHERIVQMLLDARADINIGGKFGNALQGASDQGHERIVQMLLDAGANINIEGEFESALQAASKGGHERTVRMLLDAGADINAGGGYGNALQGASEQGHERIVQMLLDAGADINTGRNYNSALQAASKQGRERIVQMLLDAGADINTGGEYNALRLASDEGHESIVLMLLDAEADIKARGSYAHKKAPLPRHEKGTCQPERKMRKQKKG